MENLPTVSVIIPTYNRKESLLRTLESLSQQTYPAERFEVILVDDGSPESYASVVTYSWPFELRYVRQGNAGEAIARNTGVASARSKFLVFLDDDMVVVPNYLESLYLEHVAFPDAILIGNMRTAEEAGGTIFQRLAARSRHEEFGEVSFTSILGGVMAVGRAIYAELGGIQPFPDRARGGWMDMHFAYRANCAGYRFRRCRDAIAYHHDYAVRDLATCSQRMHNVSLLAVSLFRGEPALRPHIPMFRDKGPTDWRHDPPALIARKLARQIVSSRLAMCIMEWAVGPLERRASGSKLLALLYRWIISGYIYRGYRAGLREYGPVES